MTITTAVLALCGFVLTGAVCSGVSSGNDDRKPTVVSIRIQIGEKQFMAQLEDNQTARAFIAMLPLSLTMRDLNQNEKVTELARDLPGDAVNPGMIREGDLMIWNSRNLVLFYKTFPTSYRYFRLGRIDDTAGLRAALGAGNVTVTFAPATSLPTSS